MKNKLQSLGQFEEKQEQYDSVWILKEIRAITLRFERTRYIFLSLDDTRTAYYGYTQPKDMSLANYMRHFQSLIDVLEHYNANIGEDKAFLDKAKILMEDMEPNGTETNYYDLKLKYNLKKALIARNRSITVSFLKRADKSRYGALWAELENQYTRGSDQYPNDIIAVYNMLLNYKPQYPVSNSRRKGRHDTVYDSDEETKEQTEISFLQADTITPGSDGLLHENIKRFSCNKMGHYTSACTEPGTEGGVQMLQMHISDAVEEDSVSYFQFLQKDPRYRQILPTWVLLDN